MSYIYLIEDESNRQKIGIAAIPTERLKECQTGNAEKLKMKCSIKATRANRLEYFLHSYLNNYNIRGEWFNLPNDIVEKFCQLSNKYDNMDIVDKLGYYDAKDEIKRTLRNRVQDANTEN